MGSSEAPRHAGKEHANLKTKHHKERSLRVLWLVCSQDGSIIQPLRKINMKGVLHYPIKEIYQCTYTDLVIIAK